jgi:hypothetical protein
VWHSRESTPTRKFAATEESRCGMLPRCANAQVPKPIRTCTLPRARDIRIAKPPMLLAPRGKRKGGREGRLVTGCRRKDKPSDFLQWSLLVSPRPWRKSQPRTVCASTALPIGLRPCPIPFKSNGLDRLGPQGFHNLSEGFLTP